MIRRELLIATAATLLVELSGCRRDSLPSDPRRDALLATRRDREAAVAIGRAWKGDPKPNVSQLVAELFPKEADSATPTAIAAHLEEMHKADVRSGRLVDLAGWMLSQTEAKLCLLFALVEDH